MRTIILCLSICLFGGCISQKKKITTSMVNVEILQIKEIDYAYVIMGYNKNSNDSITIVSFKPKYLDFCDCCNHSSVGNSMIEPNKSYAFQLKIPERVRVEPISHKQFLQFGRDTVWSGYNYVNGPYISCNSIGLSY